MAAGSLLVVATDVVQATNDKQQIEPMLNKIGGLTDALGKAGTLLADNGYFSEANVMTCQAVEIDVPIAIDRLPHHPSLPAATLMAHHTFAPLSGPRGGSGPGLNGSTISFVVNRVLRDPA